MSKKKTFKMLVLITAFAMVLVDFLLLIFFKISFQAIILRFGIPAVAFIIVYNIVLGKSANCFNDDYFQYVTELQYLGKLRKIGSIPIKMIGLNVVIHAVFLGAVYFHKDYLGIESSMKSPLFLSSLSFGMLVGTFIYVVSEGLVSMNLSGNNLTLFPRGLREKRQELKSLIIPVAVGLMSLLFGCSVTMLAIRQSDGGNFLITMIPIVVFLVCVTLLSLSLKNNSSRLYTSII